MKTTQSQVHHFNVDDAMKYGVEKAVVLSNIRFWLNNNKNKDLSTVKHDGYYWMYNTARDMSNVLPYFTQSKIQRLLKQLEDDGVLIVGNYNKVRYDRTKWYTISEYTYDENCSTHTPELNNGSEQIEQPIQDSKTNTKTNNKINTPDGNILSVDNLETINIPFSVFWGMYDYNKGKPKDVETKWDSLSDEERELVISTLPSYILSTPDKTYRKYPMSYLNTEAWNDEIVTLSNTYTDNNVVSDNNVSLDCNVNTNNKYTEIFLEHSKRANSVRANSISTDNSKEISNLNHVQYKENSKHVNNKYDNNTYSASFKEFSDVDSYGSDELHWWDLKQKGVLKSETNPSAIKEDSKIADDVNKFFAMYGSKTRDSSKNRDSNKDNKINNIKY